MNKKLEPKPADILTFRDPGRLLEMAGLPDEFRLMKEHLKGRDFTVQVAERICKKSGSHLLKMISPRIDGDHACLYIESSNSNFRPKILPSTNAPDIPFCKVLFRPLEIRDHSTASVIDHIMNADDISSKVLDAFAAVFGADVLETIEQTLLGSTRRVTKLAAGEFPIIFLPRHGGGDLQVTPVAPASAFNNMKVVTSDFFQKQKVDAPKVPRGKFHKQAISSKPQNISGAISGIRTRLLAELPSGLRQSEAEIYRFIHGGSFPRWHHSSIRERILRYAEMLLADSEYNNKDTRRALDGVADQLISEAQIFASEMYADIQQAAERYKIDAQTLVVAITPERALIRRKWMNDDFLKARKAILSGHFQYRVDQATKVNKEIAE